jgi:glycosyltransferase involved in cell wall biosynthesis
LREPRHPGRAFALADLLRARRPRHLHVYGSTYAANVTLGAAMLLGRPFSISSYVDFDFPYEFKLLDHKLRRARFFRVVTAFCADRLRQLEPAAAAARIPVVQLGLDLARWQGRVQAPRRGILLSAARLVPKKGLHLMPPVLAELRRRGLPCRWVLAGDGPELPRLQALVAEHRLQDAVEFLGPVGNDEVERRLRACDAAVLPCVVAADGERDGIPVFLTEAMALGVPVVTTPISGIPELIQDGETGYLCAPGSVDALAARLAALLSDPAAAAAVGARGRELVHARLDVADAARALLREIDEAAA